MGDALNATDPVIGSDDRNDGSDVEELSFGDPERRARAWKRAGVGRALLAGVAVVALVLGAAGSMDGYENSVRVLPPPDGPWPEGATFTISLCKDDDPSGRCHKRAITPEQKRVLEERLRATPEVAEVTFRSQETAWANFVDENADNWVLTSAIQPEDLPTSFNGRLHRRADFQLFATIVENAQGVSYGYVLGHNFWEDKADLSIGLCEAENSETEETEEASDPCAGRGAATEEEKKAIETRLTELEGVERVYFEDAAHARRVFEHFLMGKLTSSTLRIVLISENYHVKLADPAVAQAVVDAVKGMSGVGRVE
ncbi:permease-like cell division protein FtsX [Streptosporangium sp. NPDC005286]|uniref:permease-like cell division protein FtsX n=1 Tax=Streptosporangium sp. NPDC005286 TaxID=3154463 RepID=UPI00339E76CF